MALHFHHPVAMVNVLREIHLQRRSVVLLEDSDDELKPGDARERAGPVYHHGASQLLPKEKPSEDIAPAVPLRRKRNVAGDGSRASEKAAPAEEGGLIVVAVVGRDKAPWSPHENRKRQAWVSAMSLLTDVAASTTQDLIGNDLRENALYGFALIRSWSTGSARTLPGSLSFHMRAVLEAAQKVEDRAHTLILCHEVVDAVFLHNPLRIPPSGSPGLGAKIFDSCKDLGRH